MQKTASSHIVFLFSHFCDGERNKKHNRASTELIKSHKYFISSIRNPWDWYLSLWTFGVKGGGGFRSRLLKGPTLRRMLKNPSLAHYLKLKKNAALCREIYSDDQNVESFRTWLKLIHDPDNSDILKQGYSAIANFCGLMSFRYINLCCKNMDTLEHLSSISNLEELTQFDQNQCYIDFFIRQESLEDDFCTAIEKILTLSSEDKEFIYNAKKTNTSKRSLTIEDYYDAECIELVQSRDRFLIDKFNYSFTRT